MPNKYSAYSTNNFKYSTTGGDNENYNRSVDRYTDIIMIIMILLNRIHIIIIQNKHLPHRTDKTGIPTTTTAKTAVTDAVIN